MNYQPKLDGLRFVAIFFVLTEHFIYFIGSRVSGGFYGVNLFFVLSGFLITSILINVKQQNLFTAYKRFFARRFLRILPAYYLAIFLLLLLGTAGIKHDLVYLLTYTFNYRIVETNSWQSEYSPYWSLSVEAQFYLIFPVVVLLFKDALRTLAIICSLLIFVAYLQISLDIFGMAKYNYVNLLTNIAPLGSGALGAVLLQKASLPGRLFKSKLFETIVVVLLFAILTSGSWYLKMIMCPIVNTYLVVKASRGMFAWKWIEDFLSQKTVVFVGKISYGVYLFHLMIGRLFNEFVFDPLWAMIPFNRWAIISKVQYKAWMFKFPILFGLSVFAAYISFNFFEAPILKLKDRYFKY